MKDTYSDFRRQILPEAKEAKSKIDKETEKRIDEKLTEIRTQTEQRFDLIFGRLTDDRKKVSKLSKDMAVLLQKSIQASKKAITEAQEETLRDILLKYIKDITQVEPEIIVKDIINYMRSTYGYEKLTIGAELYELRQEGIITWDGKADTVSIENKIKLVDDK